LIAVLHYQVDLYAKSGSVADAQLVFDRMQESNVITWSVMIGGLAQHGHGREGYELFLRMQRESCVPNTITCISILIESMSKCRGNRVGEGGSSHALKAELESDLRVGNALVHMYLKSGCIDDAQLVFDRMQEHNAIT
jgi:pentatricopeptide repeat protein